MKNPLYFQDELDARTQELDQKEQEELESTLKASKEVQEIKEASNLLKEGAARKPSLDLEEFLIKSTRYTKEDGTFEVLEYEIDDTYYRVSGTVNDGKFIVEEFYINKKPIDGMIHVDTFEEITNIAWK